MKRTILLGFAATCVATASGLSAGERDLAAAEVFVYQETEAGVTRYTYVVKNNGSAPIVGLEVGFDYYTGTPQLVGADPARISAPANWTGQVVALEESDSFSISWSPVEHGTGIAPGQMRAGFVLESPSPRTDFARSNWTVVIDGSITAASERLEQVEGPAPGVDTLPPILRVAASPESIWPPNGKLHPVSVTLDVSDDTDPAPTARLVSVSCNECAQGDITGADLGGDDRAFFVRGSRSGKSKDGRTYTVTYEAIDASGNVAEASVTVSVPHDQR